MIPFPFSNVPRLQNSDHDTNESENDCEHEMIEPEDQIADVPRNQSGDRQNNVHHHTWNTQMCCHNVDEWVVSMCLMVAEIEFVAAIGFRSGDINE